MRIGLDFDNTIVSYDTLFFKVALEQKLVPSNSLVSKIAVRDYLRKVDKEDIWTQMQGYVYGSRMREAEAYPGATSFIKAAKNAGHELAIMSHKTQHPFAGPKYDLHLAARSWIAQNLIEGGADLIPKEQVFFELTKEEKIKRAAEFNCDIFIDDLPEILLLENFPENAERFLFDPEQNHNKKDYPNCKQFFSWDDIRRHLLL
mgnify:FL=1